MGLAAAETKRERFNSGSIPERATKRPSRDNSPTVAIPAPATDDRPIACLLNESRARMNDRREDATDAF